MNSPFKLNLSVDQWKCNRCTLHNKKEKSACDACGASSSALGASVPPLRLYNSLPKRAVRRAFRLNASKSDINQDIQNNTNDAESCVEKYTFHFGSVEEEEKDKTDNMEKLFEAASCLVCFERLRPSVSCCVNGHAICQNCRQRLDNCPTCRQPFSGDKHISFDQVLAALPACCKYDGCEKIYWSVNDHEMYCGFRETVCKVCLWKGSVNQLKDHVEKIHSIHLFELGLINHHKYPDTIKQFKRGACSTVSKVLLINKQTFWRVTQIDPLKEMLSIQFFCVPTKKVSNDTYVTIEFEQGKLLYKATIKLKFDVINETSLENRLVFGTCMLKQFVDENGDLLYNMYLETNK